MFKKLRKWYFKLYHLLRFLGIFILIFGIQKNVYAEECEEHIDHNSKWVYHNWNFYYINAQYLDLDSTKTYTFYVGDGSKTFKEYFDSLEMSKITMVKIYYNGQECNVNENKCSATNIQVNNLGPILSGASTGNTYLATLNEHITDFHLVEGTEICKKEETQQENEVYSNFMTLYIDKINYLAEGFTSNPYLIAMIGIIFTWVVLELFLKILHLRGGKYK